MTREYDIVIAGGGMVGMALACALGNTGLRIAVVEKYGPGDTSDNDGYDNRVSAITLASRYFLDHIGAWSHIAAMRYHPYQKMYVWDAAGSGELAFDCANIGQPCLGYIIENRVILSELQSAVQTFRNVTCLFGHDIVGIDDSDETTLVHCQDGTTLGCRLLVAADGARSRVRQLRGIDSHGWSYRQQAIVATVETERPHEDTAWQRFLPSGPLAFLPLDDAHHCSIVWSVDNDHAEELMTLSDSDFTEALEQAFDQRLGKICRVEQRNSFPLTLAHASDYVQARLALIGDAAHRVHPLAGQGVNLGFADAAVLADVVLQASDREQDIGDYAVLRRYERRRKGDNIAMLATTDGLKRLFGTDATLVSGVRSLGMNLVNGLGPLKDTIMRAATGLSADLPPSMSPGKK